MLTVQYDHADCTQNITVTGPGTMTFPQHGLPHYQGLANCHFYLNAPNANQHILYSFNYFKVCIASYCATDIF